MSKVIMIVGGGAAGYFAAINIAEKNPSFEVHLFEATNSPLTKVKISGGGRCNVTHNQFDPKVLTQNYPRGFKELLSVFYEFQPKDTIDWFLKRGISLNAEKDGRMFPITNSSNTIIECFLTAADKANVKVHLRHKVEQIQKENDNFILTFKDSPQVTCDSLVLATGSTPIGHELAKQLGHSITDLAPSLFTFKISDPMLTEMAGTSFVSANCQLTFSHKEKTKKFQQIGPLMITHWGLSGPAILKLSAFAARELFASNYEAKLEINFLPQYSSHEMFAKLKIIKSNQANTFISQKPFEELTKKFWNNFLKVLSVDGNQTWGNIKDQKLQTIAENLTKKVFLVQGKGIFKEEFVTCGGVNTKEIDFKTMESKICKNLYFSGEVLDIDGITGGFNFQNAWSTAWLISESV